MSEPTASDSDLCGEHDEDGHFCTEPPGHDGSHVARQVPGGDVMLARWGQEKEKEWPPGEPEPTDESVVEVTLMSMERGEMTRYLSPGDELDAPTDRVNVRTLQPDREQPGVTD